MMCVKSLLYCITVYNKCERISTFGRDIAPPSSLKEETKLCPQDPPV